KVLWMSYISIQPPCGDSPFEYLSKVQLHSAEEKAYHADYKEDGSGNPNCLQSEGRRQDHMGQKEGCQPSCGGVLVQPSENRIKYRVEEESKRADHDHYFKCHDKEGDNASTRGDL